MSNYTDNTTKTNIKQAILVGGSLVLNNAEGNPAATTTNVSKRLLTMSNQFESVAR
jgi:hypothetical protein